MRHRSAGFGDPFAHHQDLARCERSAGLHIQQSCGMQHDGPDRRLRSGCRATTEDQKDRKTRASPHTFRAPSYHVRLILETTPCAFGWVHPEPLPLRGCHTPPALPYWSSLPVQYNRKGGMKSYDTEVPRYVRASKEWHRSTDAGTYVFIQRSGAGGVSQSSSTAVVG